MKLSQRHQRHPSRRHQRSKTSAVAPDPEKPSGLGPGTGMGHVVDRCRPGREGWERRGAVMTPTSPTPSTRGRTETSRTGPLHDTRAGRTPQITSLGFPSHQRIRCGKRPGDELTWHIEPAVLAWPPWYDADRHFGRRPWGIRTRPNQRAGRALTAVDETRVWCARGELNTDPGRTGRCCPVRQNGL